MAAYRASKHGLPASCGPRPSLASRGRHLMPSCGAGWRPEESTARRLSRDAADRGVTAQDIWAARAASYPAGRLVTESEVAKTIAFLASEDASGVNGEAIAVALGGLW